MKKVVVASGKGGTGKTTLTALFAHFAARRSSVALADADVEASNLPLALNVVEGECEDFRGGFTARIDSEVCTGCGLCAEVCRFAAVTPWVAGPYRIDPWLCEGCGYCAYVCPERAVAMEQATAGAACTGGSSLGPVAFGRLSPGEDLSGRLVTEVRRLGVGLAEEARADVLLIDGPPGVGCPVIAALANTDLLVAVTEPTRSGAHDLSRLMALSGRFGLRVGVVLNKADLSPTGAEIVRRYCAAQGIPSLAEIPFDREMGRLLSRLAQGRRLADVAKSSPGVEAAGVAWAKVETMLAEVASLP